MADSSTLLLEFGAIMLIAFIGAALATKVKQSPILGYIVVGIVIGPYMYFNIGGIEYYGIIKETDFIGELSQIGLLLLIFFVGLEFSIDKIKRVKGPAVILSFIDVGINLFVGFCLAFGLGWPLVDSIFLAAVIAMSCSAVAMKSLIDLNRMSSPETEYIMGMVILEEFISMIFLTVVGGLVINIDPNFTPLNMVLGMAAFFGFFLILALLVIPRTVKYLSKMKSDEMFVLFMLGVVLLSAWFADYCGVPMLIGAFFIGMVFAETKVMDRMEKKIAPIRDAFVAIFFVSFGMLIDPYVFPDVAGIIILAVVMVLVAEMIVMPMVAYLVGFNRKASMTIGSCFTARGGESVMYASVGSQSAGAIKGAELNPVAGALTFVMSALCPLFIKNSYRMADYLAERFPDSIKYGSAVFARTLGKLVFPSTFRPFRVSNAFLLILITYIAALIATGSTNGTEHLIAFAITVVISVFVWFLAMKNLRPIVRGIDFSNLGSALGSDAELARYISTAISLGLIMCASVCLMFPILWQSVIVISLGYVCWFLYLMKRVYDQTCSKSSYLKLQKVAYTAPMASPLENKEKERGLVSLPQEMEYRRKE